MSQLIYIELKNTKLNSHRKKNDADKSVDKNFDKSVKDAVDDDDKRWVCE